MVSSYWSKNKNKINYINKNCKNLFVERLLIPVSWRRNQDLILIRLKKKRKIKIIGNGQIRLTVNQKRSENTPKKCLLTIFDIIPAAVEDNPKHYSVACKKTQTSRSFSFFYKLSKFSGLSMWNVNYVWRIVFIFIRPAIILLNCAQAAIL